MRRPALRRATAGREEARLARGGARSPARGALRKARGSACPWRVLPQEGVCIAPPKRSRSALLALRPRLQPARRRYRSFQGRERPARPRGRRRGAAPFRERRPSRAARGGRAGTPGRRGVRHPAARDRRHERICGRSAYAAPSRRRPRASERRSFRYRRASASRAGHRRRNRPTRSCSAPISRSTRRRRRDATAWWWRATRQSARLRARYRPSPSGRRAPGSPRSPRAREISPSARRPARTTRRRS